MKRNDDPARRAFAYARREGDGSEARTLARALAARMGSSRANLLFPLFPAPTITTVNPATGLIAGGDVVTITGTGFLPGALVFFGTTPAVVGSVTPTQIICTSPAHSAGTVRVTVTNFDGQSAVKVNAFTFLSLIIPDDANTIFHQYVTGGAVKNLFGGISEIGAVTRVGSTSMGFPNGKSAEGIGPFDQSNYFALDGGLFNFSGDFWMTVVMKVLSGAATNAMPVFSATSGTTGAGTSVGFVSKVSFGPSNTQAFGFNGFASGASIDPGSYGAGVFILSIGFSPSAGGNWFSKIDQVAALTNSNIASLAAFAGIPRLGASTQDPLPNGSAIQALNAQIFELRLTRTQPTLAALNALHAAMIA